MKNKMKIGMDEWKVYSSIEEFLDIVKNRELEVYDIRIENHGIRFYSEIWQQYKIHHMFENMVHIRTTGMIGYAFRSFKKPSRLLCLLLSCTLWYGLSNMIFEIDIRGEKQERKALIKETLNEMGYKVPFYEKDILKMKAEVKKKLENDIAWLEVAKEGSRYRITYTPKEFASLSKLAHDELIAQEDGVIVRFDIAHGNKVKKVNDYVHVGDVLVSNVLVDSKGINKEVFVEGRVYAYTWKDITITLDKNKMPKSFQYFEMLMDARREVSKDFRKGDKIYKENILQFSSVMGKIKMVIHYTLYKDITTP